MLHFDRKNFDRIRDALPETWATVRSDDALTFSELVRHGFHLVDMSGDLWTVLRAGRA
jgi:hypothetical protein